MDDTLRSVPNPPPVYLPFPHQQQLRHPQVQTVLTATCPSLISSSCVTNRYKLYKQLATCPSLINSSCVTNRYKLYTQLPALPSSTAAASPTGTYCTHSYLPFTHQNKLRHPQVHTVHTATCPSLFNSSSCVTHRYKLYTQLPALPFSTAAAASPTGTNCTHSYLPFPFQQQQLRHPQLHTVHTAACSSNIISSCMTHKYIDLVQRSILSVSLNVNDIVE